MSSRWEYFDFSPGEKMKACEYSDGLVTYVDDGAMCPLYSLDTGSELKSEAGSGMTITKNVYASAISPWWWIVILAAVVYETSRRK